MRLSGTEGNAIRFFLTLISMFVGVTIGGALNGPGTEDVLEGRIFGAVAGTCVSTIVIMAGPAFYELTIEKSKQILKISLLLALFISAAGVYTSSIPLAIFALVFTVSPVFYDFFRDVFIRNELRDVPWQEQKTGNKIIEIVIEAAMSSIIGLVLVFLITGHY
jgi:hypothetical protein